MPAEWKQRLLLDQNVPYGVAARLRAAFHGTCAVDHVYDLAMASATDDAVFEWAQDVQAIIITFDEDFADQRIFPVGTHCGIIRLRVEPTTEDVTFAALDRLFAEFEPRDLVAKLVIVEKMRIRIRP